MLKKNSVEARSAGPYDRLISAVIVGCLCACLFLNYYYASVSLSLRVAVGIVLAFFLTWLFSLTGRGERAFRFISTVKQELRKVIWPTRQETIQMTGLVILMIFVVGLILWGVDSLFFALIRLLSSS
jgi:preprotein translocase subunit SecE